MCTYLPGIPITLALYHTIIKKMVSAPMGAFEISFIAIYVAISPLIYGLLFDAIRHSLEHLNGFLSNKDVNMCKKLKKWCVFWSHWDHLPVNKLKVDYAEDFIKHIISIYAVQYHMYEFFYNLSFSSLTALFGYLIWKKIENFNINQDDFHLIIVVCIVAALSFFLGWIMNSQNKVLIDVYFPQNEVPKTDE
jgi:hypothetical protein